MICESCQKHPATIHQVQVRYNDEGKPSIRQLHVCASCTQATGMTLPSAATFPNMLKVLGKAFLDPIQQQSGPASGGEDEQGPSCPECGWSLRDFRQTSRFGCPRDYDHFASFVDEVLEKIHGYAEHASPEEATRLEQLRCDLDSAVRTEDYEGAARLRDAIRDLEASLEEPGLLD